MFVSHHFYVMSASLNQPCRSQTDVAALPLASVGDEFERHEVIYACHAVNHLHDLRAVDVASEGLAVSIWPADQRIEKPIQRIYDAFRECGLAALRGGLHGGVHRHLEVSGRRHLDASADDTPSGQIPRA